MGVLFPSLEYLLDGVVTALLFGALLYFRKLRVHRRWGGFSFIFQEYLPDVILQGVSLLCSILMEISALLMTDIFSIETKIEIQH